MVAPGAIIVLNGASSAGKTSLARKLQELMAEPLFHLSLDTFESMVPERFLDDVPYEQFVQALTWNVRNLHAAAAAMSAIGHNVVVDTVFERKGWVEDCVAQLVGRPVLYVGVHCPPEEIARRERERGDRRIGQGVDQLGWVHKHAVYDVEVDTHALSLDECAQRVLAALPRE